MTTAFGQPPSLIDEACTVRGVEWRALEKAVVLVHLCVHLCEDGRTSLAPHVAILGFQDPHRLGCADQGSSQHRGLMQEQVGSSPLSVGIG